MPYRIERDEGFIADLQRWASADRSLGEEFVSRIEAIEDDPFKGEWKPGGPIRGCRGEPIRQRRFAIVYELRPEDPVMRDIDRIDEVYFRGITKHDDQASAGVSSDAPIAAMFNFEVEIPAEDAGRARSALFGLDHVYIEVESEQWVDDVMKLRGQFERVAQEGFHGVVRDEWIRLEERRPIDEFLPDP